MTMPIAIVDCETTALGHLARPWEIAVIRRSTTELGELRVAKDETWVWHVDYSTETLPAGATPEALHVGRWGDRGQSTDWLFNEYSDDVRVARGAEWTVARHVYRVLAGAVLVGVGVHFDAAVLSAMFLRHGLPEQPWHYALLDLKAATWSLAQQLQPYGDDDPLLTARGLPLRSEQLAAVVGVEPPSDDERHTALGDARWAARWFDALAVR